MGLNIVCTSKPCDGLFYYSYEYASYLNSQGISAKVIVVCNRKFSPADYIAAIKNKYVHCKNIEFDVVTREKNDVTLIMGRSQMSLAYIDFNQYTATQKDSLKKLFANSVISVYSENHPNIYPKAVSFFAPKGIYDLCDHDVYPNGIGLHFEKTINFNIHREPVQEKQFEHLFLGTNARYYATVQKVIQDFPNHGIITYNEDFIDRNNNNVFAPVTNLLGKFETFVYTKDTFDPAPRIFQECKYFGKNTIYLRDRNLKDGGSVYWNRTIKQPNVEPIIKAYEKLLH
jgi:hypothetical protein